MKAIRCTDFVELVTAFLEGSLTADDRHRFIAHAGLCVGCERYLDQMRHIVRTLRTL